MFARAARAFGETLARSQRVLVYGGGNVGLMGAIADAALAAGGRVVGVIPRPLVDKEVAHRSLTELRIVESMHERKALMAELSDGFIAMPGGIGTMEEFFEVLSWAQLGIHAKPCGLLNVSGYYDPLIQFLDHAVSEDFIKPKHRALMIVEREPEKLLERFEKLWESHPPTRFDPTVT
jgi:uncharacterized protein (TIGR00730 family)